MEMQSAKNNEYNFEEQNTGGLILPELNYFKPSVFVALALGQIDGWNNKLYWVNWHLYGKILFLTSPYYHEQKFQMILDLNMIGQ